MTTDQDRASDPRSVIAAESQPLVNRSEVPPGLAYREYRQYLRFDFLCSCGYCTITEAEAQALRFTIDHYEPRKSRPELENEYSNLMYACDECNNRKGDRCPPTSARKEGFRIFKPDNDSFDDHFRRNGLRMEWTSNTGEYTVEALDLNRKALQRLREIRQRLVECNQFIAQGMLGLRKFRLDQLPKHLKGSAYQSIKNAERWEDRLASNIDDLLRAHSRSALIDPDPDAEALARKRADKLKALEGLYPGNWRAQRKGSRKRRD